MLSREERIFSELLLARGLVAREFIEEFAKKRASGEVSEPSLADVLIDSGGLAKAEAQDVLEEARAIDATLAPHLEGGTRLGDFLLIRELGRGGMGIVYEAEQESLGRRVAIKVLPAGAALDERLAIRFLREARAAGRLQHPGIVPVFASGRAEGVLFFAMEMVEGRSLAEIAAEGPMAPERAARIAAEIARALDHAHRANLVHRDVKPENILLAADGRARLTDFGLVHESVASSFTLPRHVLGTPAYMAPEQASGNPVDRRSDIYALGAVLYTLLCGKPPYSGNLPSIVLSRVLAGPPPPLRSVKEGIPTRLAAICDRAMARDPEDRYATAAEFADDLEAFGRGEGPVEVVAPYRSRRGVWVAATTALVVTGAAIAMLSMRFADDGLREAAVPAPKFGSVPGLAPALDKKWLLLLNPKARSVSRFDASSQAPAGELIPSDSRLVEPVDMAVGPDGNVYILNHQGGRILKYDGCTGRSLGDFVDAHAQGLDGCHGMAFGPDGNLYVLASHPNTEVWRFDPQGKALLPVFVKYPIGGNPERIDFGPGGDLYITSNDDTVYRFDATGTAKPAPSQQGAVFATVPLPTGLAFDAIGNVYVASDNHDPGSIPGSIYRFDTSGNLQSVIVPPGGNGLNRPTKMAFGPAGDLHIVDTTGPFAVLRYAVPVESPLATFLGGFARRLPGIADDADALAFSSSCGGALCGNGTRETGEQCDDGNTSGGDLCDSGCRLECTGNLIVNGDFSSPNPVRRNGTTESWTSRAACGAGGFSEKNGNPGNYFWINSCGSDAEPDPDPYLLQIVPVGPSSRCVLTGDYVSASRRTSPAGAIDSFVIDVDGVPVFVSGPTASQVQYPDAHWASFSATFTATGSARVRIRAEANGSDNDFAVDNLFMCCVPN